MLTTSFGVVNTTPQNRLLVCAESCERIQQPRPQKMMVTTSSTSWRVAFSRSLLPLRSAARTVYPPPAAGPRLQRHLCHGRSGGYRWRVTDYRHISIPAMTAGRLTPWYRF